MPSQVSPSILVNKVNWQKLGAYSFRRVDQILDRVANIPNRGTTATLAQAKVPGLDQLAVTLPDNSTPTVRHIIDGTDTDGWMVLHHDKVVIEEYPGKNPYPDEYPGQMPDGTRHLLMSVTKSLTATVAGILEDQGVIDTTRPVTGYSTWLQGSGYDGATVRQVLDMRSAIKFSEEYLDPKSEVAQMEAAAGWAPPLTWSGAPDNTRDFLSGLQKDPNRNHGGPFEYRSCESAVIGCVCEDATGKRFEELASDLLWSKLGVESDAYITVDKNGTGAFDGGICATLRDLARFGAMICKGGESLSGQRVVSQTWVDDVFVGGSDSEDAFKKSPKYRDMRMPDGKYRSMFWSPTANRDVVLCIGVYGQMVYINRATQTVGVKLSGRNQPVALNDLGGTWGNGFPAFLMFDKISARLG
ncbi:serine hydrolase domain-containing protein [Streptomyces sp. NPDC097107]|uniref:serine hydrolase domain-containing protein n=1 Tax=Streptomyces sp. NPDC097107 TaxID=3366089 RepID=UPI003814E5DA